MSSGNGADRRGTDRRQTVDLSWPRHQERRQPGGSRRRPEAERAAAERRGVPASDPLVDARAAAVTGKPPRTMPELERDLAELKAVMDSRLAKLKGLPEAEFEAAQARDKELVTAWFVAKRRIEQEMAQLRAAAAGA